MLEKFLSFVGAIVLAFLCHSYVSNLLTMDFPFPPGLSDAATFLVLLVIFQAVLHILLSMLFVRLHLEEYFERWSKVLAAILATIDGLVVISLGLLLLVVAPVLPAVKGPIEDSFFGSRLVDKAAGLETYVDDIFGPAAQESLGFLTIKPSETGSIALPYSPRNLVVDEAAEQKMLDLINAERVKAGVQPLRMDKKLTEIARAHSTDMWARQYFSHVDPDGITPFDRMDAAKIDFHNAGENLALAHTVERAHDGLMNSEGHRRNILDPNFRWVGIGAIDGGIYGIMFTQDFTD